MKVGRTALAGSAPSPSIFELGRNCCSVANAPRVALLVDADDYFKAFAAAAARAMHSIVILAWDFDSRMKLFQDKGGDCPQLLGDYLNWLARRRRGLHIYVLDWDYPMVFGADREIPPLYGLGWKPHRRVHLRYDNTHPVTGSHHQKIVVVDGAVAFSGGLDLTCRRWDTPAHKACDPCRMVDDEPYPPFHDLMAMVDGEAACVLAGIVRARWQLATGKVLPAVPQKGGGPDPWPEHVQPDLTDVPVGISCTFPKTEGHAEVREIEALYLDMIARARRYIYIENQYFTAYGIGEALAKRLAEPEGPEIVVVLRLLSHGWLEEHTMHVLRTGLIKKLLAADRSNRLYVCYPHIDGLKEGTCIDIHSKCMIVDDEWLRIGSANLCNRSMGMDTECDLTIEARGQARVSRVIREFRDRLLTEHLGCARERMQTEFGGACSMQEAIAALKCNHRTLKPLEDLPDWPEAVVSLASVADPERPVALDHLIDEFAPDFKSRSSSRPAWGKILAGVLVLAGLTAIWRLTPLADYLTGERVIAWAGNFAQNPWAPWIVLAAYTPACLVMFPRPLITLFAVIAFGPWLGFTYSITGIMISAAITYALGMKMDRRTVRRLAGDSLNKVTEVLRTRGIVAMTALRLVPIAPFSVEGVIAGAVRVKFFDFMVGTFLGLLPGVLAATIFGDQFEAAVRDPEGINYWLVGGVILVFACGILAVRAWFKKQLRPHKPHSPLYTPEHAHGATARKA